jgi:hypothetical protein
LCRFEPTQQVRMSVPVPFATVCSTFVHLVSVPYLRRVSVALPS